MANPSSCGTTKGDYKPSVAITDSTEVAVTLDPNKPYRLIHTGLDAAETADTSPVYIAFNETVATADSTGDDNKAILTSLQIMEIGPGLNEVSLITDNSSNEPGVVIIPCRTTFGKH